MLDGLSLEAQLLLQSLQLENPARDLPSNINWDVLLHLAKRHSVVPLLNRSFANLSAVQFPQELRDRCRIYAGKISGRNMVLKRELVAVLGLLQGSGFAVIPHKGPVLTERLYGNIGLRHFDDLDLLVHEKDVLEIKRLLLSNGYAPKWELANLTPSQERAYLKFHYTYDFVKGNSGNQLEVHWKVVGKTFCLELDHDGIWSRCSTISFESLSVPAFSAEDLLLILCIMGAKKSWDRLSRVYDVSQTVRLYPDINWEITASRARESGSERILMVGLSLASALFKTSLPEVLKAGFSRDAKIQAITHESIARMFSNPVEPTGIFRSSDQFQPIPYRMRERFFDRIRYFFRILWTPSIGDWAVVTLPDHAYFVYYLIRPVRLMYKAMGRFRSRKTGPRIDGRINE